MLAMMIEGVYHDMVLRQALQIILKVYKEDVLTVELYLGYLPISPNFLFESIIHNPRVKSTPTHGLDS